MAQTTSLLQSSDTQPLFWFLFEASNDALIIFDPQSLRLLEANPTAQSITGMPSTELQDLSIEQLFADSHALHDLVQACRAPTDIKSIALRLKHPNQESTIVDLVVRHVKTDQRLLGLLVLSVQDDVQAEEVAARDSVAAAQRIGNETELALRESENKFRVISENCHAMVAIFQAGKMVYANDMVSAITGFSREELLKMDFLGVVDPEYHDLVRERNRRRLQGEEVTSQYEVKLRTKSGLEGWIDFTASLIEYEGKPAVVGIGMDVTERRSTEERLRQRDIELAHVSRLATMGELVAGIAHEINQPLSAISNFADACNIELGKLDDDRVAPIRQWSELIGQQAVRCGDIIRRLRSYVRQKKLDEKSIRVNDVIQESIALLRNEIRQSAIDVECQLAAPSPAVRVNPVELQQVIVNLLSNAHEAMKQSDPSRRKLAVRSDVAGDFVRIDVEDHGHGIKPENLDSLFEAFFTTKPDGMGMGLAISRSIIERYGGRLWAENRNSQGAAFHVEIPHT